MNWSNRLTAYMARLQQTPGSDSPLVRWGVVLAAMILLWTVVLTPWQQLLENEREILASQLMEASRLHALQSHVEVWKDADRQLSQALTQSSQRLLQNKSDTIAQSELQQLVQSVIKKHHMKVETQQFMKTVDESGLGKKVTIELRLSGAMIDGYRLMDALARDSHLLVIEKLQMGHRSSGDIGLVIQVSGFVSDKSL